MAYATKFSLSVLLFFLAVSGQVLAGRQFPERSNSINMKQPQFLGDRSFLIPGVGRVLMPPYPGKPHPPMFDIPNFGPFAGIGGNYLPGADDTFVPNPGFEVPNPGRGGSIPETAYP